MDTLAEKVRKAFQSGGPYEFTPAEFELYQKDCIKIKARRQREYRCKGDWYHYVFSHDRGDRLQAFLKICHLIQVREKLWELLGQIWSDTENIWQLKDRWDLLLTRARTDPDAPHFMDEKERAAFKALPNDLTIYRGCYKGLNEDGYSWTLSYERAKWFSKRLACLYPKNPALLLTRQIKKSDAFAYLQGRNEDEIILYAK